MKSLLIPLLVVLSWSVNSPDVNRRESKFTPVPLCPTATPTVAVRLFDPAGLAPTAIKVRRNVDALSAAEIASIRTGIAAMKALPTTNPTSWAYQAAIHGTTLTNNLPQWNSCTHGSQYFLAWHRMYLYFFERILRAKSGNPNLALPYWNYQTNPVLNAAYRTPTAGNALFHAARSASINGGNPLGPGPMTSITNALNNNIDYFDFNGDLEGPHGSIHVAIGGDMSDPQRAAKDPIFWLHHTNIDRLWIAWLRKCGGRSNPTNAEDAAWMNKSYTFFDENGTAVSMTLGQMLNIAGNLDYRYDFPLMLPCNFVVKWWEWKFVQIPLLRVPDPGPLAEEVKRIRVAKGDNVERFRRVLQERKIERFRFDPSGKSDKLLLQLEGVVVDQKPDGVIEVYLNQPAGARPTPDSKSFVGVLDLFTASAQHAGTHGNAGHVLTLDASGAVRNLGLKVEDLANAELSFVTRGNTRGGQAIKTTSRVRVSAANFVLKQVQD